MMKDDIRFSITIEVRYTANCHSLVTLPGVRYPPLISVVPFMNQAYNVPLG